MKQVQSEVVNNLLGELSISDYITAFIFALMGLIIRQYFVIKKSIKTNKKTPDNFDPKYWFKHNFFTRTTGVLVTVIVIYLCLRFSVEWFGMKVSWGLSFTLGFSFDYILDFIRKKQNKL